MHLPFLFITIISTLYTTINAGNTQFCEMYNCICTNDRSSINCSAKLFENSELLLEKQATQQFDFSNNSLSKIIIDDVTSTQLTHLMLSKNKFQEITENTFKKAMNLRELDLSQNQIEKVDLNSFENQIRLELLNLSNAFVDTFSLESQLCPLHNIKILDLSNLNLEKFTLECWKSTDNSIVNIFTIALYLRNAKNIEKSWPMWFQYLGSSLHYIDLTNTNLKTIQPELYTRLNLETLILSSNVNLDKASLNAYLQQDHKSMRNLEASNIGATNVNLPLATLLSGKLTLDKLDVSSNQYTDDITTILSAIIKVKTFIGSNNKFKSSLAYNTSLNFQDVSVIETLNLCQNQLNSTVLYYVREMKTIRNLDLSHNAINIIDYQLTTDDLMGLFAKMKNLTNVNFSNNELRHVILRFEKDHKNPIETFDFSHNLLDNFRILSLNILNSPRFPSNVIVNDEDGDEDSMDGALDDSERYLTINNLDLSSNRFTVVDMRSQFKSILNLNYLDLSFNANLKKVKNLSFKKSHILSIIDDHSEHLDSIEWNQLLEKKKLNDTLNHLLCINEINYSNCKLTDLPSLEYVCSKKLTFANNNFENKNVNVKLTKFTLNYLKYLDLQMNNLTGMSILLSTGTDDQIKPPQSTTGSDNTYIDLKQNSMLKCDCDLTPSIEHVRVLSDCTLKPEFNNLNCANVQQQESKLVLNKKVLFLFILICVIITILAFLIIYSLVSDIRNLNLENLLNLIFCCKRKFLYFKTSTSEPGTNGTGGGNSSSGVASNPRPTSILSGRSTVPYVRLDKSEEDNLEIRFT